MAGHPIKPPGHPPADHQIAGDCPPCGRPRWFRRDWTDNPAAGQPATTAYRWACDRCGHHLTPGVA